MREKHKRRFFFLYINLATVCFLLVTLEVAGQIGFYLFTGHFVHQDRPIHQGIFEHHPYLVARIRKDTATTRKGKTITGTALATRWTGAPSNDQDLIRIAVLGGSTAFGTGVSDEDSWPALLQSQLGESYAVINYGVPGYTTVESIIQMALVVPEKQPHIVIFYQGWNDISNYHDPAFTSDYYAHGMEQYRNLGLDDWVVDPSPSFLDKAREISAVFRMAGIMNAAIGKEDPQPDQSADAYDTADPFVDRMYLRNLETLKTLADRIPAASFFVPQVLNEGAFLRRLGTREWSPFIQDYAMPQLLAEFNEIMDEACDERDAHCSVIDQVASENWMPEDFVDDGHLSREGGMKFSAILAEHIRLWRPGCGLQCRR